MYIIGANPTATITGTTLLPEGKGFGLGDRYVDHDGKEYVYVQANGAITGAGYVAYFDTSYQAVMLSTSNDARGNLVGIAPAAFADDDYGWLQVKGPCVVRVAASAAANTQLNTTGTAGQIDDDATTGAMVVDRVILTTANGGSAGTVAAIISYPAVGATL